MRAFILFVVLLLVIFLVIFSGSIFHFIRGKILERKLSKEIEKLPVLYDSCLYYKKNILGTGSSQNSDVEFSVAHQNQILAVKSVLALIRKGE